MKAREKYFLDEINCAKAQKFMRFHHNKNTYCINATLNLGIFRKDTQQLVGVAQLCPSYQENLLLNKYVKEDIINTEYLELHHFAMIKTEERNSETQALSLIIKWIRQNRPKIRLIITYAGRYEGDYGYIYQAAGWEYLGYNIINHWWTLDGQMFHERTLSDKYNLYGNKKLTLLPAICEMYQDVRKFEAKQFVYIKRLDRKLTAVSKKNKYPKTVTEYPIILRKIIYKRNDEVFHNYKDPDIQPVEYYYEKDERLFSYQSLIRRKILSRKQNRYVAVYSNAGKLEYVAENVTELLKKSKYDRKNLYVALQKGWRYKNKFFRYSETTKPPKTIKVPYACKIDGIVFSTYADAARYLGVNRASVIHALQRGQKTIKKIPIEWYKG